MQDTIFIDNIPTQAVIGVYAFEKAITQKLVVSVALETDIRQAAQTDDVKYALDYDAVSRFIDETVQVSRFDLLEALAEHLVQQLFSHFSMQSIDLKIVKPGAIAYTQQVGLRIFRQRDAD